MGSGLYIGIQDFSDPLPQGLIRLNPFGDLGHTPTDSGKRMGLHGFHGFRVTWV